MWTHVFRIVLSYSREAYSEVVRRQTTEEFISCIEGAFWHFRGVPKTLVIDNLKAAVTKADWFDPDLNQKIQALCGQYGTVILPTRPYTPCHRGQIEAGVKNVQSNALTRADFGEHKGAEPLPEGVGTVCGRHPQRMRTTWKKQVSK